MAYEGPREARAGIGAYFEFFNCKRFHQTLDYKTPMAVYKASLAKGTERRVGLLPMVVLGIPMIPTSAS